LPFNSNNKHNRNRHGSRNTSQEVCTPLLPVSIRMIRSLLPSDFDAILKVINDAAQAYKGIIPNDRWKEPYMSAEELKEEIEAGVRFFGWMEGGHLLGVAGIQALKATTLIRHAYVLPGCQRGGTGTRLLEYLMGLAETSEILVGTWADATWAIRFYEKHGFKLVSSREKDRLLRTYWNIPERQIETSVVLRTISSF
jgi:GNAT superfamily N-acetyltransferase